MGRVGLGALQREDAPPDPSPPLRYAHGGRGGARGARLAQTVVRVRCGAPHHLPFRHRRLAIGIGLHPPAAALVAAAERQINRAFVFGRAALDHRPVALADRAGLEQLAQCGQRLAVAAEHQAARGLAVEPVGERRSPRQPEAQRAEMVLQALAALGAAVDRDAGGLVDHQHQPIAIEQPSHHLFGVELCVHQRNRYHGGQYE